MELFSTGVNHGSRRKHNKGRIPGIGETNWSETVQSIAVDNEAIVALFLKNIRIHSFSRLESQESVNLCWAHLQLLIIVTFHSAIPCTSTPVLTLPTMMSFKEQTQNPAFILPKKKKTPSRPTSLKQSWPLHEQNLGNYTRQGSLPWPTRPRTRIATRPYWKKPLFWLRFVMLVGVHLCRLI